MPNWFLALVSVVIGIVVIGAVEGTVGFVIGIVFIILALYFLVEYAPRGRPIDRR